MARKPTAKSILRNMKKEKKRVEPKTPIADGMFLPNNSGVGDFLNNRGVEDASITNLKVDHIAEKTTGHKVVFDNDIDAGPKIIYNAWIIAPTGTNDLLLQLDDHGAVELRHSFGEDHWQAATGETVNLGSDSNKWKDLYLSGVANCLNMIIGNSIIHDGDPDTLMNFGMNAISFQAAGASILQLANVGPFKRVLVNQGLADIDFIVNGDTVSDLLKVNASTDTVGIDTATPTLLFSVKEKSGMTPIGGFAIKLTNETGAVSVAGETVKASVGTADAVDATGMSELQCIGVFLDSGIAEHAEAWVVVSGIADVKADGIGWALGDRVVTSGTARRGVANNNPAVAVHFQEIGHAVEGAGANALGRVVLHFN